jgi:glycosyltransferase involved in cell wall biosynthesis
MAALPTVSVVIPCFNHGQYLAECLQSLQAQTFQDFEVIVVDDGSTQPASLAALAAVEAQVTQVIRSSNQGVIAARNTGIAAAKGRYILPLDADDKIGARYLALAVAKLDSEPLVGIVYCQAEFFGEQQGPWQLPPYVFPNILIGNVIFNAALFRKSEWTAVGGYNSNMGDAWEDFDFWLALIARGAQVYQIPETLFFYRINKTSRNNAMQQDSARYAKAYTQLFYNHTQLYVSHIDTVFNELVRLWGVINDKNQQIAQQAQALQEWQQRCAELTQQQQALQAQLAATPLAAAAAPAPTGVLSKLQQWLQKP